MAVLLTEMDRAGELDRIKFLWYDIPDPRLQQLMFKSLGFTFDMNKSNPMKDLSMALNGFLPGYVLGYGWNVFPTDFFSYIVPAPQSPAPVPLRTMHSGAPGHL